MFAMARLYSGKRGSSGSTRPLSRKPPAWCKYNAEEVEVLIVKLTREGNNASTVGMILRDRYGIPLAKPITGKTINELLKASDVAPKIPEDLEILMRKADSVRRHLEKNKPDKMGKRSLALIESKIYRLVKYYKNVGVLPSQWEYKLVAASVR
jgi:small subunit ribosomal protein S15